MATFSLFRYNSRLNAAIGMQPGIGCDAQKLIPNPLGDTDAVTVHHMRQTYAASFPQKGLASVDYVLNDVLRFARDPDAVARGDIPPCWQAAVAGKPL